MATKSEKDKQKTVHDKNQMILSGLLRDDDNKYCVDCDAKGYEHVIGFLWYCKMGSAVSAWWIISVKLSVKLLQKLQSEGFVRTY